MRRLIAVLAVAALVASACGDPWQTGGEVSDGSGESEQSGGGGFGGVDYNCDFPGTGCPWLRHIHVPSAVPEPGWEIYTMAGLFESTVSSQYSVALPVRVRSTDARPLSMDDAYRLLCAGHPQLGGSSLRFMTFDEKDAMDWIGGGTFSGVAATRVPHLYTDGSSRAIDEAHIGWEQIRVYYLPPIPQDLLDYLASGDQCDPSAPQATTTTVASDTQRWGVSLVGFEVDEMDPYWRETTRVRGAVLFEYDLQGEFVLRRDGEAWTFESGSVTAAAIHASYQFEPETYWELRDEVPRCPDCADYVPGRALHGNVDEDTVRLSWGPFQPRVDVEARIVATCTPMPSCAEWGERLYVSETFVDRAGTQYLPLIHGHSDTVEVVSPQGDLWVAYTYTLLRLDA